MEAQGSRPPRGAQRAAALVLAAGLLYSLFLQFAVRDEVFFSGDGGLKLLVTRQLAAGDWNADLRLDAEPWVSELWQAGLYPFGPPFVYGVDGRHYVHFPPAFSMISAPLYAALGFRGLYVIPLLSTWMIWACFYRATRRRALGPLATGLALTGLVFASPLTLYGATFWEHTLSVALGFGGLVSILRDEARGAIRSIGAGIVLGLASWFRPEAACLALGAIAALPWVARPRSEKLLFIAAAGAAIAGLLLVNYASYGLILGLHALQVVEVDQLYDAVDFPAYAIGANLTMLLGAYCPSVVVCVALAAAGLAGLAPRLDRAQGRLWVVLLVFLASSLAVLPATGGQQFGPRYWLPAIPVIWLIAALQLQQLVLLPRHGLATLGVALFASSIVAGGWVSGLRGARLLYHDYSTRVLPALALIRERDERVIAVEHQWIAQELASAFEAKRFFRVKDGDQLMQLARRMHAQGEHRALWLRYDARIARMWKVDGLAVRCENLGRYGSYFVFGCRVEDDGAAQGG